MKKVSVILLIIMLAITFVGCKKPENEPSEPVLQNASTMNESSDKNIMIIVPDTEDIVSVTTEELNAVKAYAESRVGEDAAVTIDEENKQVIVAMTREIPDNTAEQLTTKPTLTFRDPNGTVIMDGSDVLHTEPQINGSDSYIEIQFTENGRTRFTGVTKKYKNQTISVYLDETLITEATVYAVITEETVQLICHFSAEEMINISTNINFAILPYPLKAITQ